MTAWRDFLGRQHLPVDPQRERPRIVSLVPSLTELLCDLGLAPWLVGRTGFCIHPAAVVAAIPKVGGTKDVRLERVRALAPTHLVVNIDENEKPVVEQLAATIPHLIVTHPQVPTDNPGLYRLLGGIFRAEQRAEELCAQFEAEYTALRRVAPAAPRRVLYCIWKDPWMTVAPNTYIGQMLAEIGWHQWRAPDAQRRYPEFTWTPQLLDEIDEIVLSSEPYRFRVADAESLERQLGKPVRLVDGEMLSWYGSRAIAGMSYLRQLVRE